MLCKIDFGGHTPMSLTKDGIGDPIAEQLVFHNLYWTTCAGQRVPDISWLCAHPLRLTAHDCNGSIVGMSVGKVGKRSEKSQKVLILRTDVGLRLVRE